VKNRSECAQCGYLFPWEDVGNDPRTPCPECGSTDRHFARTTTARVSTRAEAHVQTTQQRSQRKPTDLSDEPKDEQGD
jgi:predicted  nucleic acid-binding Zn-ribbon protein